MEWRLHSSDFLSLSTSRACYPLFVCLFAVLFTCCLVVALSFFTLLLFLLFLTFCLVELLVALFSRIAYFTCCSHRLLYLLSCFVGLVTLLFIQTVHLTAQQNMFTFCSRTAYFTLLRVVWVCCQWCACVSFASLYFCTILLSCWFVQPTDPEAFYEEPVADQQGDPTS